MALQPRCFTFPGTLGLATEKMTGPSQVMLETDAVIPNDLKSACDLIFVLASRYAMILYAACHIQAVMTHDYFYMAHG